MNIQEAEAFATWLDELRRQAWAAFENDDQDFDQDALGLIDWALLLQTGVIWQENKLRTQMVGQLRELIVRLENPNPDEDWG